MYQCTSKTRTLLAKRDLVQIIKIIVIHLNRYNFRTVNAIDFIFSTLHKTPFLNVNLYLGNLYKLRVNVMRPDYP